MVFLQPWLFDCYLIHVPRSQCRYSNGLANMRSNIRCSHSLRKSRVNVKLYKQVTTSWRMCFETKCTMTLQSHLSSMICHQSKADIGHSTYCLSLPRFRDIRAFVRWKPLFPLFQPNFGCPFGVNPWCWSLQRAHRRQTNRDIIFGEFQPMIPQRHGQTQTDGRTDDLP